MEKSILFVLCALFVFSIDASSLNGKRFEDFQRRTVSSTLPFYFQASVSDGSISEPIHPNFNFTGINTELSAGENVMVGGQDLFVAVYESFSHPVYAVVINFGISNTSSTSNDIFPATYNGKNNFVYVLGDNTIGGLQISAPAGYNIQFSSASGSLYNLNGGTYTSIGSASATKTDLNNGLTGCTINVADASGLGIHVVSCVLSYTTTLLTTGALTSAALTTSPLTSAAITSSPVTSAPVTTGELTSSAMTSSPLTTSPLTSADITSSPVTSAPVTTGELTSSPMTSSPLTTARVTSAAFTSGSVTTSQAALTTAQVSPATTGEVPLTTSPVTSSELTTAELTTGFMPVTSAGLTSAEITSGTPVTTGNPNIVLVFSLELDANCTDFPESEIQRILSYIETATGIPSGSLTLLNTACGSIIIRFTVNSQYVNDVNSTMTIVSTVAGYDVLSFSSSFETLTTSTTAIASPSDTGISDGALAAAIIIPVVIVVFLAILLVYELVRRKKQQSKDVEKGKTIEMQQKKKKEESGSESGSGSDSESGTESESESESGSEDSSSDASSKSSSKSSASSKSSKSSKSSVSKSSKSSK